MSIAQGSITAGGLVNSSLSGGGITNFKLGGGGGGDTFPADYGVPLLGLAYESRSDPVGGSGSYYGLASSAINMSANDTGFFVTNILSGGAIREIALSDATDVTTETLSDYANQGATRFYDFHFKSDGTVVYGIDSGGTIYEYTPVTPFRGDGLSAFSSTLALSGVFGAASYRGLSMNQDGTKLYAYTTAGTVHQGTMSTPWDLSTLTDDVDPLATGLGGAIYGMDITPDGEYFLFCSDTSNLIRLWDMATAEDASSATELATYDVYTVSGSLNQGPLGVAIDVWNKKLHVIDYIDDRLYQFSWTGVA